MDIRFKGNVDKFWNYRSARMTFDDIQMEISVSHDIYSEIEKFLKANGCHCDNHICWKTGSVYYMFSDWVLKIGNRVIEGNW